jgi:hypothetical protein
MDIPFTPNSEMESLLPADPAMEQVLYARHAEIENFNDLLSQRGTPIPAIFNQFYKFIQNPSSVSVETYKRMIDTDDTIGSGVDFLTTALASRIGMYQHPSKEITDWVNNALEKMEGGWFNTIKEILSATWAGFYVGEKVWENSDQGFIIKKLVSLPPQSILFEADRSGSLTRDGILQYQRNYNPGFAQGGVSYLFGFSAFSLSTTKSNKSDPYASLGDFPYPLRVANQYAYMSVRIPKAKCVHYSFDAQGKFGNPYGRSLLRRAYNYYVMKHTILQMMAVALDRKGTPLMLVYSDPHSTVLDSDKFTEGTNAQGKKLGIRADLAAMKAFQNVHNDSVIFLPGKEGQIYSVKNIEQHSNAGDFIQAADFCNKGIMRALLLPSLIFSNGDGTGSFALGQEHAKTFDKICDGILSGVKHCLLDQVIKEMIAYNFEESAWKKDGLGSFSKRQLTQDEIQKEMEVVDKGVSIGAIDMNDINDLNVIREKLGFEPRDEIIQKDNPFQEVMNNNSNPLDQDNGIEEKTNS